LSCKRPSLLNADKNFAHLDLYKNKNMLTNPNTITIISIAGFAGEGMKRAEFVVGVHSMAVAMIILIGWYYGLIVSPFSAVTNLVATQNGFEVWEISAK